MVRFLIIGPITGVLVGYAQVTVAVIVWVLHGEPDFYFRGGDVVSEYLIFMVGGGAVGVVYGAVLLGLENLTHRRIQPMIALGLVLVEASCSAAVVIAWEFNERMICWSLELPVGAVAFGLLATMAVSRRNNRPQRNNMK